MAQKPKITAKEQGSVKLYLMLMEEAKVRFDLINFAHRNDAGLPPAIVREICYLQFRFLCEIIALGCLAAHGDIRNKKAMNTTYEPGKLLKSLEVLNPHFYPQPTVQVNEVGRTGFVGRPDIPHLTKADLPKLWGMCGGILHRTPMATVYAVSKQRPDDMSDIFEWSQKLTGLLNSHWITLVENKQGLFVTLRSEDTGKAKATIMTFGGEQVNLYSMTLP